jgi:hypothetical protein
MDGLSGSLSASGDPFTITPERYNTLGEVASQSFQLTISSRATGFGAWIAGFSGLSDATKLGDPDNDRFANLADYLFVSDPGLADGSSTTSIVQTNSTEINLDYRRSITATGVAHFVKWKSDLPSADHWSTSNVSAVGLSNTSTFDWRRATAPVQPGETRKFLRLEIQQQNEAPICLGSNGRKLRLP